MRIKVALILSLVLLAAVVLDVVEVSGNPSMSREQSDYIMRMTIGDRIKSELSNGFISGGHKTHQDGWLNHICNLANLNDADAEYWIRYILYERYVAGLPNLVFADKVHMTNLPFDRFMVAYKEVVDFDLMLEAMGNVSMINSASWDEEWKRRINMIHDGYEKSEAEEMIAYILHARCEAKGRQKESNVEGPEKDQSNDS